jgi:chromosome segregation ATPase
MCFSLNACDSLMGTALDIKSIAQIQKEKNEAERERELNAITHDYKQVAKKLNYTQSEAQALGKRIKELEEDCANSHQLITLFFLTTISAVGYIIYDKCCSADAIKAKVATKGFDI